MIDMEEFRKKIVHEQVVPKRDAVYTPFPARMMPGVRAFLERMGISMLYSHQGEMFDRVLDGENVVITTSTASGKTLGFLLPVVQEILTAPTTRALFLYPTKALASDQFRALGPLLEFFGKSRLQAGIYDGDTPPSERGRIRGSANIILTNPEMLNATFLPNHNSYGFNFLFANLKYIVVDELHSYRGAFGSHLANVMKRLGRICCYYGSSPRFLCSSATIANPAELAEKICGCPFSTIEMDGSPSPEKRYYLWQPPMAGKGDFRISPAREAPGLIAKLALGKTPFLAFCKSRNAVEVVLKESRDRLKDASRDQGAADISSLIAGYRGGYRPMERRAIEEKMAAGELRGLVATNVLELGIDIGRLDAAVLVGFPGTRASFWQQAGRAGRKGRGAAVFLLLDNLPMDQYLAIDPGWLFSGGSEHAVADPDNLFIQLAHVRAAAAELPLSPDDAALFPDLGEIVPVLLPMKELRKESGRFFWSGGPYPAGDISLRNMDKIRYRLKNSADGSLITEMDELQAFREIYGGAIYLHEGLQYLVERLDLQGREALARPAEENYYTVSCDMTEVHKIRDRKRDPLGRTFCGFGDVRVAYTTVGFRRQQFHNHQNLGMEMLDQPLAKSFETEGFWIALPDEVRRLFLSLGPRSDGLAAQFRKTYAEGLAFTLLNSAMRMTMTTTEDMSGALLADDAEQEAGLSVCIFDMYSGGLGFANRGYELIPRIIGNAVRMVEGCPCSGGCSACVGDFRLDKRIVLWGLKSMYGKISLPENIRALPPGSAPAGKRFSLETLPEQWSEFVDHLLSSGEYLSRFLAAVPKVRKDGNTLVLEVPGEFFRDWLTEGGNGEKLTGLLQRYAVLPSGFTVRFEWPGDGKSLKDSRLNGMYRTLTGRDDR
ncbi:DEAD/DEAH box helicase [Aminivibrio sp.]|uniref:DEAD/DEAH box helicase n=1 Tax=Aminivibrio sp. TaxID=1872489 RepID=UPI00345EE47C